MTDPHDSDVATPVSQDNPPASTQRRQRKTRPLAMLALGSALLVGVSGLVYATAGGWRSPEPVLQQFLQSVDEGNRAALKAVLVPRGQETLTRANLDQLLAGLPEYKDDDVKYRIVYPDGIQRYFTRHASVVFMLSGADAESRNQIYQPIHLQLNRGAWGIVPTSLFASAASNHVLKVQRTRQSIDQQDSMSREWINKIRTDSKGNAAGFTQMIAAAQEYDEEFTAQRLQKEIKDHMTVIEKSLLRISQLNTIEDMFDKSDALSEAGNLEDSMELLNQILQSTIATDAQKSRAGLALSTTGSAYLYDLLTEANNLYGRAEYQESISTLQKVIASSDANDSQKADAQYLLSFAYREYKEAPNNMQRAISAARVSTELDRDNAGYWCHLGDLLRLYEVHNEANEAFQKGIQKAESPSEKAYCYVWQGVNYQAQGEYEIAKYVWETALSLDPGNEDALRFLGDRNW